MGQDQEMSTSAHFDCSSGRDEETALSDNTYTMSRVDRGGKYGYGDIIPTMYTGPRDAYFTW